MLLGFLTFHMSDHVTDLGIVYHSSIAFREYYVLIVKKAIC